MIKQGRLVVACFSVLGTLACGSAGADDGEFLGQDAEALHGAHTARHRPSAFSLFEFTSTVSTSGAYADGDVRLEAVSVDSSSWSRRDLQTVRSARILVDDGIDEERGGNNLAAGQGISSEADAWATQGPATITPTGADLARSLGNLNLTSLVVTRENVGTASVEVRFAEASNRFFFWERGNVNSPTTANSDLLVEALDPRGRVVASHKLLRGEFSPTGIPVTTWNGSFASPSTPEGTKPELGAVGLTLRVPVQRLRLTSVQQEEGGIRDDGPDYKVIAARHGRRHHR